MNLPLTPIIARQYDAAQNAHARLAAQRAWLVPNSIALNSLTLQLRQLETILGWLTTLETTLPPPTLQERP